MQDMLHSCTELHVHVHSCMCIYSSTCAVTCIQCTPAVSTGLLSKCSKVIALLQLNSLLTVTHEAILPDDLTTHVTRAWTAEASELELVAQDTWKRFLCEFKRVSASVCKCM